MLHGCQYVQEVNKIYSTEQGCTRPLRIKLSNGESAILKYSKNPMHDPIILTNELISSHIAKKINLNIPTFGIAKIDNHTKINIDNEFDFSGIGFYSSFISSTSKASPTALKYVTNLDQTCKIILFDEIIKNADRQDNSILIPIKGTPNMYIIDHSHSFGDPSWNANTLIPNDASSPYVWNQNRECYSLLINAGAPVSETDFLSAAKEIKMSINDSALDTILSYIPSEWNVSAADLSSVKDYVLYRVENLDHIIEMIINERGV